MPNPDENNSPVKNKEKASKEFAQENDIPKRESINVESNYKSKGTKPVSVNIETTNESRAIGHQTTKKPSNTGMGAGGLSEDPKLNHSAGSMGGNPKSTHSGGSGDLSPGSMGSEPKKHVADPPKGDLPKVNGTQSSGSGLDEVPAETAKKDNLKQEKPSGDEPSGSGDSKKKAPKEKKKEIVVPLELKGILDVMGSSSKNDDKKVPTESSDKDGGKKVAEAMKDIERSKKADTNPEDKNGTPLEGKSTATKTTVATPEVKGGVSDEDAKKAADAKALTAFSVTETKEEVEADAEISGFKNEGKTEGLTVGRSVGYGAMIEPIEGGKFNITKFSENDDAKEEQEAKNTYIQESDKIAKNMDEFGQETKPESDKDLSPKEGYYDAYIEGYNEGHREGSTLKKEAAAADRTAQMKKEQGTDEYMVGASLGMLCGVLTAKGEKEVDTTFSMTIDGEFKIIELKTTVAELDSAAFDKKQTPEGELSGAVYEKAFLLHYNMGYREGRDQRTQPPPMDDDYKLGYEQGYKLGNQKGKGEAGDPDLVKVEKAYDAKDQQALKKEELQQYRGFYAGYNKGYAQVAASKKNKAQTEREEKNKKPEFILGYSTGNLKGFLMAMIEPSGIDLATALKSTAKMTEAGIPDYFPIPDKLRETILATLTYGDDVAENEGNDQKALLGRPLFKEGLLFGWNRGYSQGQKSRAAFKRDKHKMHPDYQESVMVLMPDKDAEYTGPVAGGGFQKGFTIGQILANAEFEFNELTKKDSGSEEDKIRITELSKAMAGLNEFIGKKSSYYKSGANEFYNWWMGVLAKRAQDEKVQYGYSGKEGSPKREGFEWGMEVGAKVIEGKEKIKEIKRKGRSIEAHTTKLNNAIKNSETAAKAKAKSEYKTEDYYIGYRNGYNHSFRLAKEDKKSDSGNLGTAELAKKVSKGILVDVEEIAIVIKDVGLELNKLKESIGAANTEFKPEAEKAFKDGLSRGYNSGYSKTVIEVETGIASKAVNDDKKHIAEQYNNYLKIKSTNGGSVAFGMLYYFLLGYQYHKVGEEVTFGLPKGIADGESFNYGYEDGEKLAKSEGDNNSKSEKKKVTLKPNKEKAVSKNLYEIGFEVAKKKARYDKFKGGMIKSVQAKQKEVVVGEGNTDRKSSSTKNSNSSTQKTKGIDKPESKVDLSLTSGLGLLEDPKEEKSENLKIEEYYGDGFDDAERLWSKIFFMRKGVKLEGSDVSKDVYFDLLGDGESLSEKVVTILTNDEAGEDMANEYYYKKDFYINQIANAAVASIVSSEMFESFFSFDFWFGDDDEEGVSEAEDISKAEIKEKYIKGYKARITSIEKKYNEKFLDHWLYDMAYYLAVTEVAPDTKIEMPMSPYTQVSGNDLDESSPYFKNGYLEGLKTGNLIKTGIIKPSDAALAKLSGSSYNEGFEDGEKTGKKEGADAAKKGTEEKLDAPKNPLKEIPLETEIIAGLKTQYKKDHNGIDDAMHGDYEDAYVKAYFTAYEESKSYEYGRILGYRRGIEGGDAMFNSKPEEGIEIKDENAFFIGFDQGRNNAVSGLPKENLENKELEKETEILSYGEDYTQILKKGTANELNKIQNSETKTEAKTEAKPETKTETKTEAKPETKTGASKVLKDLVVGDIQDFHLDKFLLWELLNELEGNIEYIHSNNNSNIGEDLEEIERNRSLAVDSSGNDYEYDFKHSFEKLAELEKELEDKSLAEEKKEPLNQSILVLKKEIAEKSAKSKIQHDWQTAEAAGKEKIEYIRLQMKNNLAFDAPIELNEQILNQLKVNLESSKGNETDIYDNYNVFNEMLLKGEMGYNESKNGSASISGVADFRSKDDGRAIDIGNVDILMEQNGFKIKAKGLSHTKSSIMTFMNGSIVTPNIEGGEHEGKQYKYSFADFRIHAGQGLKSQIDGQKDKLEGGPV